MRWVLAEKVGFEPTVPFRGTHDFQSCTFDHSATSPEKRERIHRYSSRGKLRQVAVAFWHPA